jgi:hypothetical protein
MNIQPMSSWNESGSLKSLRKAPAKDALVIALDPKDAAKYGLAPGKEGLIMLYENLPVAEEKRNTLQFDPSMLPFLSQRLLIVLSRLVPENYSFYQRRLAEFQSRLESTLEVGRIQVHGINMLDLTGAAGPWIKAASPRTVRPPDDVWSAWSKGERQDELSFALAEASRRGWRVVTDAWTPERVRNKVPSDRNNVDIKAPENDQDFFTYLHDIYLQMWSSVVRKN